MAFRALRRQPSATFAACCVAALLLSAGSAARAAGLATEIHRCEDCHGPGGHADVLPVDGRIAGQNEGYLVYILKQYRAGRLAGVNAAIMSYCVRQLSDDDIRTLARYYARLAGSATSHPTTAAAATAAAAENRRDGDPLRGRELSGECAPCHDGDGRTRFRIYPRIAAQTYDYLLLSMKEFRSMERHQAYAGLMWPSVAKLSDQDLRDLAAYYASLPW